jgi:hypothetical protein
MTLSWNELSDAIGADDDRTIGRTNAVQKEYRNTPRITRAEIEEYFLQGDDYAFTSNPFPYDVDADHYILWLRYPLSYEEVYDIVCNWTDGSFLVYENHPTRRSVPHTRHWHVFIPSENSSDASERSLLKKCGFNS